VLGFFAEVEARETCLFASVDEALQADVTEEARARTA
jgi:hypothetical protein